MHNNYNISVGLITQLSIHLDKATKVMLRPLTVPSRSKVTELLTNSDVAAKQTLALTRMASKRRRRSIQNGTLLCCDGGREGLYNYTPKMCSLKIAYTYAILHTQQHASMQTLAHTVLR